MLDRGRSDERVDGRWRHPARDTSSPESCGGDVVASFQRQEFERLEAPAEPTDGPLVAKALEYLLKDDADQEDVLAVLEERAQLAHGGMVSWTTSAKGKCPDRCIDQDSQRRRRWSL